MSTLLGYDDVCRSHEAGLLIVTVESGCCGCVHVSSVMSMLSPAAARTHLGVFLLLRISYPDSAPVSTYRADCSLVGTKEPVSGGIKSNTQPRTMGT